MMSSVQVVDHLTQQKNKLIEMISDEKFEIAFEILTFVTPMWRAENYGYKIGELLLRISNGIHNKVEEYEGRQDGYKKNTKDWKHLETTIQTLSLLHGRIRDEWNGLTGNLPPLVISK